MNQVPNTMEASESGTKYVTGKLSFVSSQQEGVYVIGVSGGQNPGQYTLKSNLTDAAATAIAGLTNKANFWGSLDSNNQINTFAVYAV